MAIRPHRSLNLTRFDFLRRLLGSPTPSAGSQAVWVAGSLLAPTLVRAALAPLVGDSVPFAAFYPSVLVVSVGAGWQAGIVAALLGALIANYLFVQPFGAIDISPSTMAATLLFLLTAAMTIVVAATLRRTVDELDRALHREKALRLELAHRVKNNLAVVQGLAQQTARVSPEPQQFYDALSGRLAALGQAHNVLSTGEWVTCEVPVLVAEALGPFQVEGSIAMRGDMCQIPPGSCVPLVLALHELATNATKYGSLSVPDGRVDVAWRVEHNGSSDVLVLTWQESGGPKVELPARRGLGSRLLRPQAGLNDVRLRFDAAGVRCEFEIDSAQGGAPQLPPSM